MKTTSAMIAALLLCLLACSTSAQDAPNPDEPKGETVAIAPLWKKGQSVRTKVTVEASTEQDNPAAGKITMKSVTTTVGVETVQAIDDKDAVTTELAYESIAFKQEAMGKTIEWDSTKPDEGDELAGGGIYKAMLKHKYTMKYNAAGKLVEVKGFDKLLDEILKRLEGNDEQTKEMMRASLSSTMSDKVMLRTMSANYFYPSKLVGKGDSWEAKNEMPLPIGAGAMVIATKFKLEALEPGKDGLLAKVSGEGTIAMAEKKKDEGGKEGEASKEDAAKEKPAKDMFDMFEISIENGKQTVETLFNVDRGLSVKQVAKVAFDMKMTMKQAPMEITTKTTNTTTLELLPDKPAEPPAKPEAEKSTPEKPETPKKDEGK